MIDYLGDLGLKNRGGQSVCNIIMNYEIDSTSQPIEATDILTFINSKIKKAGATDVSHCIALEDGIVGDTIRCQIVGIVNLKDSFVVGKNYYFDNGELTTVQNDKHIGLAITKDELLLKRGAFIHV